MDAAERVPDWSLHPELVAFYESHRNRPEDLYPSEARFLPWLAERAGSVLDVGCAAGGFRTIWQAFAPSIGYEGIDVSPTLVEAARRLHPGVTFRQGDVLDGIDLPDGHADVVQALGWLHWVRETERALAELWRLARRWLFFDVRLSPDAGTALVGSQKLELVGQWDGSTTVPYVVVPWPRLAETLVSLEPAVIRGYGYLGRPAESAEDVPSDVCFATFVLERGRGLLDLDLDIPFEWPLA